MALNTFEDLIEYVRQKLVSFGCVYDLTKPNFHLEFNVSISINDWDSVDSKPDKVELIVSKNLQNITLKFSGWSIYGKFKGATLIQQGSKDFYLLARKEGFRIVSYNDPFDYKSKRINTHSLEQALDKTLESFIKRHPLNNK